MRARVLAVVAAVVVVVSLSGGSVSAGVSPLLDPKVPRGGIEARTWREFATSANTYPKLSRWAARNVRFSSWNYVPSPVFAWPTQAVSVTGVGLFIDDRCGDGNCWRRTWPGGRPMTTRMVVHELGHQVPRLDFGGAGGVSGFVNGERNAECVVAAVVGRSDPWVVRDRPGWRADDWGYWRCPAAATKRMRAQLVRLGIL